MSPSVRSSMVTVMSEFWVNCPSEHRIPSDEVSSSAMVDPEQGQPCRAELFNRQEEKQVILPPRP